MDEMRGRCAHDPTFVKNRVIACTISGGLATYPASGTTVDDVLHAADHAMFEAKNADRDLVRPHPTTTPGMAADTHTP